MSRILAIASLLLALVLLCAPVEAQTILEETPKTGQKNQLANETSPYLLQHAQNPVNWRPWNEASLELARKQNKMIFLSIGYSSCHWCHVMEHESFEDAEIAAYLNEHFVCIKVDREERPDVDAIYMLAVQLLTRRGGWPLSVFLTPEAKPFFGGTYFPARDGDRNSSTGFFTICQRIVATRQTNKAGIEKTADQVAKMIESEMNGDDEKVTLPSDLTRRLFDELQHEFDSQYGGFGFDPSNPRAQKFPQSPTLLFLLDQAERGNADALTMLTKTVDHMAMGGLWDHLGGGFHRYCVDRFWTIPHFEKMLYDNGQLATIYSRLAKLTGNSEYETIVEELLEFVQRELTSPDGGFYSAMDADSEGVEGKYFRWTKEEWERLLGEEDASWLAQVWAADKPNFEGEFYVPQIDVPWSELATKLDLSPEALRSRLDLLRDKLLVDRTKRVPPMTDTKILTSWNGLMIRGLADAGRCLERPEFIERATKAANFVTERLLVEGRLKRTYTAGRATLNGYLDDYAFFVDGLLALHEATDDPSWLRQARTLTDKQVELFWDEGQGGFFFTSADHEKLIVRGKLFQEGARPSGSSISAANLMYLAKATGQDSYREKAQLTVKSAARALSRSASSAPGMVMIGDE